MKRPLNVTELIVDDPRPNFDGRTGTMTVDGRRYDFATNKSRAVRLWLHLQPFVKRRLPLGSRVDLQAIALAGIEKADKAPVSEA